MASVGSGRDKLISDWVLLGCAVPMSISVGMIFQTRIHKKISISSDDKGTRFGSETKYIDCTDLTEYSCYVKMGGISVVLC